MPATGYETNFDYNDMEKADIKKTVLMVDMNLNANK